MSKYKLTDGYEVKGFKASQKIIYLESKPNARIIQLIRIQKKLYVNYAAKNIEPIMIKKQNSLGTFHAVTLKYI
jgi:hypothetical protein